MEQPKLEQMKYRFKKRHPWKLPHEITFADDSTELGGRGKDALKLLKHKPHSHPGGRKPRWRILRKAQRRVRQ